MQIIFGTKRLGKEDGSNGTFQKYPDTAVVTLEGVRGHGKSRRFLFNKKASEAFNLEQGVVNQLVFGTLVNGEEKGVLISNANDLQNLEGLTIYKTSKNAVSFDDSKEKGKAVSSSIITGDITSFLGLDDSVNNEFTLKSLNSEDIDAMILVPLTADNSESPIGDINDMTVEEEGVDPFAVTEAPAQPIVEDVNWENDEQESQVTGLTRATTE
jgi:hypothetical protein